MKVYKIDGYMLDKDAAYYSKQMYLAQFEGYPVHKCILFDRDFSILECNNISEDTIKWGLNNEVFFPICDEIIITKILLIL